MQTENYIEIQNLFSENGLELSLTCKSHPEQYDVFKDGKPSGYIRLRHGQLRVDYPDCGDKTIYSDCPDCGGFFKDNAERLHYMTLCLNSILKEISNQ